jgi:elongation factor P
MKANTIRKGTVLLYNDQPHRVMEFFHNTPGKGRAVVQAKLRNLISGNQTETRFNSSEDVTEADVNTTKATYLYADGEGFIFMMADTYEQVSIGTDVLGDAVYYLQEQMEVDVTNFEGVPIGVTPPPTVVLTVVETEPELRGATASNSPKPAKTDTGLSLTVPPFVKEGERITVNTSEGKYLGRADD